MTWINCTGHPMRTGIRNISFKQYLTVLFPVLTLVAGVSFSQTGSSSLSQEFHVTPYVTAGGTAYQNSLLSSTIDRQDEADTLRLLAIRVDFAPDTLITTFGNGSFFYEFPDTMEREDWIVDAPPHDSLYFSDQLLAVRRYFERFSNGNVVITGLINDGDDSGGDVFPRGNQASYHLPYPVWHINYGNEDRESRLDTTLTELFVDAWQLADQDPELDPRGYDLFVIFHAGAGNEFDTGYDQTPHDIPSVYIALSDLQNYADLDNGIEFDEGFTLTNGVILPATQKQPDVDVGLLGTICHQVGFMLGMPHLYQPETGDPGIGKYGLMDRGFGGFFGIVPTPPCAWSRLNMGWETAVTVDTGSIAIAALGLPDSVLSDSLHRLVRVPINMDEYYLLEARYRDPEDDSISVAYDRDGRRMIFHNDYEVEAEEGFRVAVEFDDYDFDTPARGMLIWHIDNSVIRQKIDADRIQEDRWLRGVDLEEADGSEDIGEEYEFLTPGDGSEYGVMEDAWYRRNEIWMEANGSGTVEFSPYTYPSTNANSGGMSHLVFTSFSSEDDTMRCYVTNDWDQGDFPDRLTVRDHMNVTVADLDGDTLDELIAYADSNLWVFNGDGSDFADQNPVISTTGIRSLVVGAFDASSNAEQIVYTDYRSLVFLSWNTDQQSFDAGNVAFNFFVNQCDIMVTGPQDNPGIALLSIEQDGIHLRFYNSALQLENSYELTDNGTQAAMTLLGTEWSDTIAVVYSDHEYEVISRENSQIAAGSFDRDPFEGTVFSGNFDGDDLQDFALLMSDTELTYCLGADSWQIPYTLTGYDAAFSYPLPIDIDHDGTHEFTSIMDDGYSENFTIAGLEPSGVWTENTPVRWFGSDGIIRSCPAVADESGDGFEVMFVAQEISDATWILSGCNIPDGREILGFPIDLGTAGVNSLWNVLLSQLDTDKNLELVAWSQDGCLKVINLPSSPGDQPTILWGSQDGSNRGTRRGHEINPEITTTPDQSAGIHAGYVWPNPVIDEIGYVRFRTAQGSEAKVTVYDLVGRKVLEVTEAYQPGQESEVVLDCSNLASGVYVARLEAGGDFKMIRFAVVK